jgi:hypothetical protein
MGPAVLKRPAKPPRDEPRRSEGHGSGRVAFGLLRLG